MFWITTGFILKECSGGMFGEGCSSQCGLCALDLQCHHKNGTCFNGCEPGYASQFCNQSKWVTHCKTSVFYCNELKY